MEDGDRAGAPSIAGSDEIDGANGPLRQLAARMRAEEADHLTRRIRSLPIRVSTAGVPAGPSMSGPVDQPKFCVRSTVGSDARLSRVGPSTFVAMLDLLHARQAACRVGIDLLAVERVDNHVPRAVKNDRWNAVRRTRSGLRASSAGPLRMTDKASDACAATPKGTPECTPMEAKSSG